MIDKILFFSIALIGILITIILFITEKKTPPSNNIPTKNLPSLTLFTYSISIIFLLYICRVLIVSLTGTYSKAYTPTLTGIISATTPLIIYLLLLTIKKNKKKNR
ncbi:MAG: hypothetical protein QXS02_03945 [Candidatus Thermoplasmatota archaeon]